jgi:DnaJ-class molecular chaperone
MDRKLYDVLGVPRTASTSEIKKAYLKLARTHHPDKGGDPERFKEIVHANEVLTDEVRRRRYDECGATDDTPHPQGQAGFSFPFEMNMADLFGNMFGFGGAGPAGPAGPGQQRKGKKPSPSIQTIPLRFEQFYHGYTFEINIHRQAFCGGCDHTGAKKRETCRRCNGAGMAAQVIQMGPMTMHSTGPCPECQGRGIRRIEECRECGGGGFLQQTRKLSVVIPAGCRAQEVFVFPEVCSDHPAFERPGDVHILLQEDPADPAFRMFRRVGDAGQHLETTVTVSLADALLGTVIELDAHPGYEEGLYIALPAGTFPKDVYVLEGAGMPLRSGPLGQGQSQQGRGELRLLVEVVVSEEERERMSLRGAEVLREVLGELVKPVECTEEQVRRVRRGV